MYFIVFVIMSYLVDYDVLLDFFIFLGFELVVFFYLLINFDFNFLGYFDVGLVIYINESFW